MSQDAKYTHNKLVSITMLLPRKDIAQSRSQVFLNSCTCCGSTKAKPAFQTGQSPCDTTPLQVNCFFGEHEGVEICALIQNNKFLSQVQPQITTDVPTACEAHLE